MKIRDWNRMEQSKFLKEFGMLLNKGYSVTDALILLELHYWNDRQYPVKDMITQLKKGIPLFEVLEGMKVQGDILGYLYFASEQGKLAFGLLEGSRILQKREDFKRTFLKTIRYPLTLLIILGGMMFFMIRFLIPQYSSLFDSVNLKLPKITIILISALQLVPYVCYFLLVIIVICGVLYPFTFRRKSPHDQLRILLKIPVLSRYIRIFVTQFFSFQFGNLLKGGLSVSQAIQLFENQQYVRLFQEEARIIKAELRNGKRLEEIFQSKPYFLPELVQVVAFGQSNGNLGDELTLFSEMLFSRLEEKLHRNINLIQPVLFGVIGVLVLVLFLSVMAPIFQLFQSL